MYSGDSDTPQRMTKDIRINMEINTLKLSITPTEKKNETRLFIFIYLKTMF